MERAYRRLSSMSRRRNVKVVQLAVNGKEQS